MSAAADIAKLAAAVARRKQERGTAKAALKTEVGRANSLAEIKAALVKVIDQL